jgi:hypothetical protein
MKHVNRLLAAIFALALLIVGALVIVEVIAYRVNSKKPAIVHWHTAYAWAHRTTWKQGSVRVTCIVIAVVGLILLLTQLRRRRPTRLPVNSDATDAAYTRRSVAATVTAAVTDVDGIRNAKVAVTRRKVTVAATAAATQTEPAQALREPAVTAAQQRLDALDLKRMPSLSVRVRPRSS